MTRAELLAFMRSHRYAVEASVSPTGGVEAAVVGIVVTDDFEIFFDTLAETRKARNLRRNAAIAFVIGGTAPQDERSVQYEGVADQPEGAELERLKAVYLHRFPDGVERQSWPGLIYLRAQPSWVRYSDFNRAPPEIVELDARQLRAMS
ncbi:MAG: pyridoxamine 5'-phosphate oxidase family protein [Gemmatimonadales bacterium]